MFISYLITLVLIFGVLMLDLLAPLGVAGGMLYTLPVLTAILHNRRSMVGWLVVTGIGLTLIGYLFSPSGGEEWKAITNRVYSVLIIMAVGAMLWWLWPRIKPAIKNEQSEDGLNEEKIIGSAKSANIAIISFVVTGLIAVAIGWGVANRMEADFKGNLAQSMMQSLDVAVRALDQRIETDSTTAKALAKDKDVLALSQKLLRAPRNKAALSAHPAQAAIRSKLWFLGQVSQYKGFFLIDAEGINIASSRDTNLGVPNILLNQPGFLERVMAGETLLSRPMPSEVPLPDEHGNLVKRFPTMFIATPVVDGVGRTIGVFTLRIDPHRGFSPFIQLGRFGETGETYAFDPTGLMLSESRFEDQLRAIGLLTEDEHSDLKIYVRDPGVNLLEGQKPNLAREQMALTKAVQDAINGNNGYDMDGYLDYRGVEIVGAWQWLDDLGMGITIEVDADEGLKGFYEARFILIGTIISGFVIVMLVIAVSLMIGERLKRLYVTSLEARREAEAASGAKSEFLSSMSHELRTPLNAIVGFSQLLETDTEYPLSDDQMDSVGQIKKGGEHLLGLINEILDLAKIESGKILVSIEPIEAHETIENCLDMVREMGSKYDVSIGGKCEWAPDLPERFFVMADRNRLRQVILNLLSNAVKYNRKGGRVSLRCDKDGDDAVRFSIIDTGIGIAQDLQKELFQPFHRLHAEGTAIEGTGIGLTITQKLVELMGGEIGFDSVQGKGSTFWVRLGLAVDTDKRIEEIENKQGQEPLSATSHVEKTILYIEDNPANLMLMEKMINRIPGRKLISAHTAEIGLVMAEKQNPDLILMDINLPGMNGVEALKHLQENAKTANIPVIAISANAMPRDIEMAMKAGFKYYITKPFVLDDITEVISRELG